MTLYISLKCPLKAGKHDELLAPKDRVNRLLPKRTQIIIYIHAMFFNTKGSNL